MHNILVDYFLKQCPKNVYRVQTKFINACIRYNTTSRNLFLVNIEQFISVVCLLNIAAC